jgi:hypothetical protein
MMPVLVTVPAVRSTPIAVTLSLGRSPHDVAADTTILTTIASAIGVYGPADSGTLTNEGTIHGGAGLDPFVLSPDYVLPGGDGVYLLNGVTATNTGAIFGGAGGPGNTDGGPTPGGAGGRGAYLAGATLTNNGTISGGSGGAGYGASADTGGAGVAVGAGETDDGSLTNSGGITGGSGASVSVPTSVETAGSVSI